MATRSRPGSDPGPERAISSSPNEIKPRVRCRADGLRPTLDHPESWSLPLSEPRVSSSGHFKSPDGEGPLPDLFIEPTSRSCRSQGPRPARSWERWHWLQNQKKAWDRGLGASDLWELPDERPTAS